MSLHYQALAETNEMLLPTAATVMSPAELEKARSVELADLSLDQFKMGVSSSTPLTIPSRLYTNLYQIHTKFTDNTSPTGAYVGYGAFGYCRIAKHRPTGTICAVKAMAKGYLIKVSLEQFSGV
jgi:hypothetical protein